MIILLLLFSVFLKLHSLPLYLQIYNEIADNIIDMEVSCINIYCQTQEVLRVLLGGSFSTRSMFMCGVVCDKPLVMMNYYDHWINIKCRVG